MREHLQVARWVAQSAPALLVGSVALRLLHGETRAPNDVDFVAPLTSLDGIAAALMTKGYTWKSWERSVEPPFDVAALPGRIYLRGSHASLPTLDLTYESPMHWTDAWARRDEVQGLQLASAEDLATIMRARGTPRDLEWCAKLTR
ncbi:MAG: hypothetical protein AB8H86_16885 [Polyangiales bacterium]